MSLHPLTNFELQKYYQNEPRINGIYSKDNLPEKKKKKENGAYVINLDEYADVGTHWIALFVTEVKLFISIVLVFNMFLKKFEKLLGLKT